MHLPRSSHIRLSLRRLVKSLPNFCYTIMCHSRRVKNIYLFCGHTIDLKEELIQCADSHCRLSPFHPVNCVNCKKTCWQYRQFPEQYAPQISGYCPSCSGRVKRG